MEMIEKSINRNTIHNSISQAGTILKYEFMNFFRSRRFYILLSISLIISALLTSVVGYYRPASFLSTQMGFYAQWWGMSSTFVIVLSGIFFGGDAISGEFQNKTGFFLIPNPIRKSSIYVGKWLAAFIASSVILAIYTAITIANGVYYFGGGFPTEFIISIIFAWYYLAAVLSFSFLFSSLFKNSSYSILVTAILFLFIFSLIQNLVSSLVQIEPWFLLTYGAEIIANILIVPYPPNVSTQSFGPNNFTLTSYNATVPEGLVIMTVYIVVTAILGMILFERREFN